MNIINSGSGAYQAFRKRSYFSALDGLRAISILLVLLHHTPGRLPGPFATLQENGRYGVAFFFVISGFLICTLFLREEAATGRIDLWKFYGRRALRLFPLYYAVLALTAVLVFTLHQYTMENQQLFRDKLASYAFYYSNWLPTSTQGPFFCAWSLAVEEQFYLGFGLLLFFLSRRVAVFAIVTALACKILVYQLWGPVDVFSAVCRVLFSYREPILLGVLLAFLLNQSRGFDRLSRWLKTRWMAPGLALGVVLWLCLHAMRHESAWDSELLYLLMTLIVAASAMRPETPLFGNRFLTHVGKVSYGIYLLHMFVFSSIKKWLGESSPWISFVVGSALVIGMASLVYEYFESPIIRFYKRKLAPAAKAEPPPVRRLEPASLAPVVLSPDR